MSAADHYPVRIYWDERDGGFVAVAPDLPGCSAFGDTREEAARELSDAIEAWIEAARNAGNPIPVAPMVAGAHPASPQGSAGQWPDLLDPRAVATSAVKSR